MKNVISLLLIAMLLFGCGTPSVAPYEEVSCDVIEALAVEGAITGDVFFNDIAISRLFIEPNINVLGEPSEERGAWLFYDDNLEIMTDWCDNLESHRGVAIQVSAWAPYLNQFEINGVKLGTTREELIAALGNPLQYYEDPDWIYYGSDWDGFMSYNILSPNIGYTLVFRFEIPDVEASKSSISIFRMH